MIGGRELTIETGAWATLAAGAVTVRYGETVLLVTAQSSERPSTLDFLPLTVEFEERHYAVGKIPGSFLRREGRPGERAILSARITDRQVRPLFPKGFRQETQVIVTVLSADQINAPDVLAPLGASAALSISDIPWNGPCASLRVGYQDGRYLVNPTTEELERSQLDLVVAGSRDAVLMVEAGAREVDEELLVGAIEFAHREMQPLIDLQETMRHEIGQTKYPFTPPAAAPEFAELLEAARSAGLRSALLTPGKKERGLALRALREQLIAERVGDPAAEPKRAALIAVALDRAEKAELRRLVLEEDLRADGRDSKTVRPISIAMHPLPRPHGSALFTRGETQVLGVATLGAGRDEILIDDLGTETGDKFLLHYNMPPYSTGEVKRLGGQSRREIGHGNLAKRAIRAVLPDYDSFPYVLRLVGDVLQSNGSTSMATVCAGCLALMDAGVPIRAPVAGVAMGLVMEGESYRILTDILGLEDALGDMDFKVCGTAQGVTALQMDIKIAGITPEIMRQALAQARAGRMHILDKMAAAMPQVRPQLPPTAPRILTTRINPEKIGQLIGPGGKNIRELEAMGAQIDISSDGTVRIYSTDAAAAEAVLARIRDSGREAQLGEEFDGTVVKITNFGAFINLYPGTDGMLHISQMAEHRLSAVEEVMRVGDKVRVKIVGIDDRGKIDLTRPELEGKVPARRAAR